MTHPDPVIVGCLAQIRVGEMTAAGVLADHMEETGLPFAASVRIWLAKCQRNKAFWDDAGFDRRSSARWEVVAFCRRELRRRIANLFGQEWDELTLDSYVSLPRETPSLFSLRGDPTPWEEPLPPEQHVGK